MKDKFNIYNHVDESALHCYVGILEKFLKLVFIKNCKIELQFCILNNFRNSLFKAYLTDSLLNCTENNFSCNKLVNHYYIQ